MNKQTALEVFDGTMLGDAGLHRALLAGDPIELCYGVKNSRFTLRQSAQRYDHMDWLAYIRDALTVLGVEVSPDYPKYVTIRNRGKLFKSSILLTLTSSWLTKQRRKWYISGAKEVPRGFSFTPISLANMWMGDGNSTRDHRYPTTVNVHLFVQDFSIESVEVIENALHNIGIISTGRGIERKGNSGITITILQDSVDYFMDAVEPHVVPSYLYKIKHRHK